jgi:quinolinate synthase
MYRIHPAYLAWVLEALVDGQVVNEITVADGVKASARVALDRMLSLPGQRASAAPRETAMSGIAGRS